MQLWLKQIEEREHLVATSKIPGEEEIRKKMIEKGEERKEIKSERLKSWEERAEKEEEFRNTLAKGINTIQEMLTKEQEDERELRKLMKEEIELRKELLREKIKRQKIQ